MPPRLGVWGTGFRGTGFKGLGVGAYMCLPAWQPRRQDLERQGPIDQPPDGVGFAVARSRAQGALSLPLHVPARQLKNLAAICMRHYGFCNSFRAGSERVREEKALA